MAIHYEITGHGEPLVLLNGIMMSTGSWFNQLPVLSKRFRCLLHDFRGQLRSERPPVPFSMSLHVDDLASLLDDLHIESAHVVGTSYGGEVGMMFAAAHPKRVRSLSVIACAARVDDRLGSTIAEWAEIARTAPGDFWDATLPYNYSPAFVEENPQFIAAGKIRVSSMPAAWFESLAALCDAFQTLEVDLSAIRCPTLVISAAEDRLKPLSMSREMAEGIEGARMVVIPGGGHAVVFEKPDEVNRVLLDFLSAR